MSVASTTAPRWVVSTRISGEVLTVGCSAGALELALLGVPAGFTPAELEGWLHDLAGVALETSREDVRVRPIPALLHHALTGLLFSQAEVWGAGAPPGPCSAAFVDLEGGAAFGWVGEARVSLSLDGVPANPRWVLVRDESGREARGLQLPVDQVAQVTIEYWLDGRQDGEAPLALEAEWTPVGRASDVVTPTIEPPLPVAQAQAPAEAAAQSPPSPLPAELSTQQPGLASAAGERAAPSADRVATVADQVEYTVAPAEAAATVGGEATSAPLDNAPVSAGAGESSVAIAPGAPPAVQSAASVQEPSAPPAPEFTLTAERERESGRTAEPISAEQVEALENLGEVRAPHPVARWLGRMLSWGRRPEHAPDATHAEDLWHTPEPAPEAETMLAPEVAPEAEPMRTADRAPEADVTQAPEAVDERTPLSAYDALLSEHVPATPVEQAALELGPQAGAMPVGTSELERPERHAEAAPVDAPAVAPADVAMPTPTIAAVPAAEPAAASSALPAAELAPAPTSSATVAPAPTIASAPAVEPAAALVLDSAPAAEPTGSADPAPPESGPLGTHARTVAEMNAVDAQALPVLPARDLELPQGPMHIDREPVGADTTFAIPRLPARESPPAVPPVLRVAAAAPPRLEPAASAEPVPAAPTPTAPPALRAASAPPVLRVPAAAPNAAPPVLRVQVPGRPAEGPPMLRVAPMAVPPPTIVPTPPVAPSALEPEAYAPSEGQATPADAPARSAPRAWPVMASAAAPRRLPPRAWRWGAGVLGVFAIGWLLGVLANPDREGPGPVARALRAVGLGPAHFDASVNSSPNGAWIVVDGKDVAKRTPADIELSPGAHTLTLTLPDLGSAQVQVRGEQGTHVAINPPLNGALAVYASDPSVPISVSLDGRPVGYAPLQLEAVAPGLHELQFSGPGMPVWAQTVQVGVRSTAQVVARPMMAPSNGVIQVTATVNDERGSTPLQGAQVWVDGELHGVTPTSLDLPRGPHSLRLTWRGETAPVQVIELPGGNQRFASFAFGLATPSPQIVLLAGVHPAARQQNAVVSAGLQGLQPADVREAWLHTRMPEGLWRRYPMTVVPGTTGPVVVAVFPSPAFDTQGQSRWYVSVTTQQGDEYFSDMQTASIGAAAAATPFRHRAPRTAASAPTPPAAH